MALKPIFKITDVSVTPKIKYVFCGNVKPKVSKILAKISSAYPVDLDSVGGSEYWDLCEAFGSSWEIDLGIYQFHYLSGLIAGLQPSNDCEKLLKAVGIRSLKDFRDYSASQQADPLVVNCGRRKFGQQMLGALRQQYAARIKFITDYPVRLDDSIKTIKRKLFLAMDHYSIYVKPEWQHLWIPNKRTIGVKILDRSTDREIKFEPDLEKDLTAIIENNKEHMHVLAGLQNRLFKVHYFEDTIIDDHMVIPKNEIWLTTLPGSLDFIQKNVTKLPVLYQSTSEFSRVFLSKYFDMSDKINLVKYIDGHKSYNAVSDARHLLEALKDIVKTQEAGLQLIDSIDSSSRAASSNVQSVTAEVNNDQQDVDIHDVHDKSPKIDLEIMFQELNVDKDLVFLAFRGRHQREAHNVTRYKVKKDLQLVGIKVRELKSWLNPMEQWLRKPNTLTLKFKPTAYGGDTITVVINSMGDYKVSSTYGFKDKASLKTLQDGYTLLYHFFTRKLAKVSYQLDRVSDNKLQPPIIKSVESEGNVQIKNMTVTFVYPCKRAFKYEDIRAASTCFFPYLSLTNEQGEISKFWKRVPKYGTVINRLIDMDLYDLSHLMSLSRKDWQNLVLLPNSKANDKLVDEFHRHIVSLAESKITFYFKRHSRFDTLNTQKRLVSDFLNSHNLSLQEMLYENVGQRAALMIELRRRLSLTTKEAQEVLTQLTENTDFANKLSSRVSAGIRCDLHPVNGEIRVLVQGIKNFTPESSLNFLLQNISEIFAKLVHVYEIYGKEYSIIHQKVCSLHTLSDPEVLPKDSAEDIEEDIDYDDIDDLEFFDIAPTTKPIISEERSFEIPTSEQQESVITPDLDIKTVLPAKGSYHLGMLQARDPYLFVKQPNWKDSFAMKCQKNQHKQPVILTEQEFLAQDRSTFKTPKGTPNGFKYRGFYYICPEIWCPTMVKALHPDQLIDPKYSYTDLDVNLKPVGKVVAGRCPNGEQAIIANDGINGWKAKGINPKDLTQGRMEYPGFLTDLHPDGIGIPCCFQTDNSAVPDNSEFFRLLANEPVRKKVLIPPDSSRRYVLGINKFPLDDMRFGDLPEPLDALFNKLAASADPKYHSKIFHEGFRRCLRLGIPQSSGNSFVTCVARIFDMAHKANTYQDDMQFRAYLAANLQDISLARSLKNGYLKLIFEDYPSDDFLSKFRDYLQYEEDIDYNYIWDLISRPLPWLLPKGLNLFIFKHNFRTEETSIICPMGEVLDHFYDPDRINVFLFTDGKSFEPIVRVTQKLTTDPFFPQSMFHKAMDLLKSHCRGLPGSELHPLQVYRSLSKQNDPGLKPAGQVVNSFNRVKYIITSDRTPVPVNESYGPLYVEGDTIAMFDVAAPIRFAQWESHQETLSKLLKSSFEADGRITDNGKTVAITVSNGLVVPISSDDKKCNRLPVTDRTLTDTIDEALYRGKVIHDKRAELVGKHLFLTETILRLRNEIADYFQRDLKVDPSQQRPRVWLQVHSIINSVDEKGVPLPVWAKRVKLAELFLKPKTGIMSRVCATQPAKDLSRYWPEPSRKLCSASKGATQESCNATQHCSWSDRCKLYVPQQYFRTFAMLVVEDLLRNTIQKDMIMENRIDTLVKTDRVDITSNQITFDDEVAPYVAYILERFDAREFRRKNLPGLQNGPTVTSDFRQIKEQVIFDGFLLSFIQNVERACLRPILFGAKPQGSLAKCGYSATPIDVYSIVAYALFASDDDTQPILGPDQVRQDIVRYIKSHNPRIAFWRDYKKVAVLADKRVKLINSLTSLCTFVETSDFKGCIADFQIVSTIYSVSFKILNSAGKVIRQYATTYDKGHTVCVVRLAESDFRLVKLLDSIMPKAILMASRGKDVA